MLNENIEFSDHGVANNLSIHVSIKPVFNGDGSFDGIWKAVCIQFPDIFYIASSKEETWEGIIELLDDLTSPYRVLH